MFTSMTLLRRIAAATIVAGLSHPVAAQTAKGSGYTTTLTTDSGGVKHTMSMKFEVLDSKLLMSIQADASGTPVDMQTIIDTVAGTMTNVMPAMRMVTIADRSIMKMAAAPAPAYAIEIGPNPTAEMVDLGPGEPILGHATKHTRVTLTYTLKITIGGETCSKPSRDVSDVWTTTEVQLPDLPSAIQRFTGASLPAASLKQLDSLRNKTIKGMALRRTGTTVTTGPTGDTLRVVSSMEIAAMSPGTVDPGDFEIPSDYRVMDMRETMAGMDPAVMQEAIYKAQLAAGDKMKALLCGGADVRKP
jgi:hypothetical protein